MIDANLIQQTYDRCASFYDLFFKPWLEAGRPLAIDQLHLEGGETILEIGVGTGLGFEFYPPDVNVVGFDYSHGMLKESKEKARNEASCPIQLVQMDLQSLAFPPRSFSHILASYVMTVVPDTEKALREILRVAKPGARVVFINHLRSRNRFLAWFEDTFHPVFSKVGLFTLDRDLLRIMETCGITDYEIHPTSFLGLHYVISFSVPG